MNSRITYHNNRNHNQPEIDFNNQSHNNTNTAQYPGRADSKPQRAFKMFVGGLAKWITEEDLKGYFSNFAKIKKLKILREPKTGNSKGFGFIFFKSYSDLKNVLNHPESHQIRGRIVDCQEALGLASERDQKKFEMMNKRRVFIGNVSKTATDQDLTDYFSQYGCLKSAYLLKDYKENFTRRYGFVVFQRVSSAKEVIRVREHFIKGKMAICEEYKTKDETIGKRKKSKKKNRKGKKKLTKAGSNEVIRSKKCYPELEWVQGSEDRNEKNKDIFRISQNLKLWHYHRRWEGKQATLRLNRGEKTGRGILQQKWEFQQAVEENFSTCFSREQEQSQGRYIMKRDSFDQSSQKIF